MSRWLDRYEAIVDRLDHKNTLIVYYSRANVPRSRKLSKKKASKKQRGETEEDYSSDSSGSTSSDESEKELTKNPMDFSK